MIFKCYWGEIQLDIKLYLLNLRIVNGKEYRVLMFKIPAAATGIPTDWKTNYYERAGESLVPLKQYKIDAIRSQERRDWSNLSRFARWNNAPSEKSGSPF